MGARKAAELAQNRSNSAKARVDELIIQIDEFLQVSGASPADIRSLAEDVLSKGISLRPEQITDLAHRINETISSLTNIDFILSETADDLASANALKDRADTAKVAAEGILTVAQQVVDALNVARKAQELQEMENEYVVHESRLTDLSATVMALNLRMNGYLQVISDRSDFYRTCQK